MSPVKLVIPVPPRSGAASFRLISQILEIGTYIFPDDGKFNGSGAPGRLLEDLLGISANNAERINMTEGISKEILLKINPWDYENQQDLLNEILGLCTDLDPWLPIDENTPKDKPIHLFYPYNDRQLICQYKEQNGWGLYVEFDYQHPTHYKLLSPMPPTEQPNLGPKAPGAEINPSVV